MKREPNDKDWERLFRGIPLSEQEKLYLSYRHCSYCGRKIDSCGYTIVDNNIYCDKCLSGGNR